MLHALSTYLRKLRGIALRDIIVTNGAQEAFYLIARLLLQAGDLVAVENPGYPQAWRAFRTAGAQLVGLDVDSDGMTPEALRRLVRRRRVRLIYLTPLHQFPTTASLPPDRRRRLYEIAAHEGIPIIEDDYDHEFHYRHQPQAPMASDDPRGIVIYVSTFSKILFPAMRLAFVSASSEVIDRLTRYRDTVHGQSNGVIQDALAAWMREGGFERHLRRMAQAYRRRRDQMAASTSPSRPVISSIWSRLATSGGARRMESPLSLTMSPRAYSLRKTSEPRWPGWDAGRRSIAPSIP